MRAGRGRPVDVPARREDAADLLAGLEAYIRRLIREELVAHDARSVTEYVTVRKYARRRGLWVTAVRKAIAERRLAVTRIGRAVRIPAEAMIQPCRSQDPLDAAEQLLGLRDLGQHNARMEQR